MRLKLPSGLIAGIIAVLPLALLSGQDYHPLPDEDIRIYKENSTMLIVPPSLELRGVEAVADGERLLTNSSYLEKKSAGGWEPCFHDTGNWWAEEIIWNEGLLTLILEDGSMLRLDTRLEEGQSSDLTGANDDLDMSVTVISKGDKQTFAGMDTVKTFKVNIFDKDSGEPEEDHLFDGQKVVLGKNTGLISTFPFNTASMSPNQVWSSASTVELDIKAAAVDEITPDYLDYFPFQKGDELHILSTTTTGPPDNSETREKLTFTNRDYDPQTGQLILTFEREMQSYSNYYGEETFNEKRDTGSWTINPGQLIDWELVPGFFDHIPGEPIFAVVEDHWAEMHLYTLIPAERSDFNQRELILHREYLHEAPEDACEYTFETAYDRLVYNNFYIEGMGGGYYRIGDHHSTSTRKPVYVSTNDLEWGEPFDFTVHTQELADQHDDILLYPNPVRSGENLRLETGDIKAESYFIYNLDRQVQRGNLDPYSDIQEIETGSLTPGFHHIEFEVQNGQLVIKRIVVYD